ncbi:MAG TPA: helix-turn-helix domain-containing protein [Streptosporangiaceae bacterium]|nr:helix-turn-helix domain-containing protein [Streptosporangiaceae bacterium]
MGAPVRSEARGPGRPRDPNLESRVFAAVLEIYAEAGWSGFSFDAVARSAGVGKAPLYLRWKTKEDLLLSALSAHYRSISITDSGNLREDLIEYAARLLESKASPDGWAFLRIHLEATVAPPCRPGSPARSPSRTSRAPEHCCTGPSTAASFPPTPPSTSCSTACTGRS